MKVRPLGDRVIVRRIEKEEKKGGIVIPDTAKEKPVEGEVIAVGPGARDEDGKVAPIDLKKGDRVLFGKYAGMDVEVDGEEYLVLREADILGIL
ncbi:MAG: co-chaperone GroES [Candidatus Latescibacterota bacterium]|nr:MAG: co-chaperone GroES [Candidatus Latescibacterota bacterium]